VKILLGIWIIELILLWTVCQNIMPAEDDDIEFSDNDIDDEEIIL